MGEFRRNPLIVVVVAAAASLGASAESSLSEVKLLPRVEQLARPDWLTYSGGKNEFTLRPVTAADLVSAEGECAAPATEAASAVDGDTPLTAGGIALQMTECDVVRRAGRPEQVQVGADERGERAVVLTYQRGPRPGIYRFAGGRLKSVERAPGAPAERPKKGKAAKKTTRD